jgi:hypothetical protein
MHALQTKQALHKMAPSGKRVLDGASAMVPRLRHKAAKLQDKRLASAKLQAKRLAFAKRQSSPRGRVRGYGSVRNG